MAVNSRSITRRHFGKTMRLFAPLYVSNECVNNCSYCGFSRDNAILRTTLTIDQVVTEARHLHALGFRNILLVAGEHPKFVSEGYLQDCIDAIKGFIPTIGIEVGPMKDKHTVSSSSTVPRDSLSIRKAMTVTPTHACTPQGPRKTSTGASSAQSVPTPEASEESASAPSLA